jgi:N-acetylglucosamine kinase-like BadF-type ATPase
LAGFISELAAAAGVELDAMPSVSLGVAGVTNLDGRERLFKELDRLLLTDRALVTSDVEAAYEVCWGDGPGVLACVGTGAICWARDDGGSTHRASGRGPALGGDPGSGYWMGRNAMVSLIMNEQARDTELDELRQAVVDHFKADNFEEAARLAGEGTDQVGTVARLGKLICRLAEGGNEVALAIVQEGSQGFSEDLTQIIDAAGLRVAELTIGTVGGVIEGSALFRRLLAEALSYDFQITWQPPKLGPVFGAGLIAARLNGWEIDRETLLSSWKESSVPSLG